MEFFCFNISSFGREIARCGGYSFALFRLGKDFQIYVHITLITDKLFFATKKEKRILVNKRRERRNFKPARQHD